ncbi:MULTISPECIES: branched-chain amino acid aminotransferase [Paenibacillus]|uniref:Branched-chain-amino-acid aminotransferase n=1 Tax=Paenibacillus campinasensis TaxID=66347 RepID=A0A268EW64_9BACL|nr:MULTISPECIES: branched-chain amino acid aminotransferase [Paenibacillus]PAD77367.1 branched chain amino acid aminotransferase [Paenibacillus campinasensis]PAK50291.1 branched chain amino acid aminotransferase [Paenibacillus sp. 7541]
MVHTIAIEPTTNKKPKPSGERLEFGTVFTDHMFMLDYDEGKGWHDPRIVPYQPIELDPAAKVFHYGQTVFEGLKAYLTEDQRTLLFRPNKNIERLNLSNHRLSIPALDEELVMQAISELVLIDRDWIPSEPGTSLYIRPFVFATEPLLGVAPSRQYKFMIILSVVGSYYQEGINPVSIYVEPNYVRAVTGGVGHAKTAGNYAAGLKAQEEAHEKGYSQVLWLDGVHRKYIEEVGSMNVFFKLGDTVVTPALNGSILNGVTRNSVLELLRHWNIPVEERALSIDEIAEAHRSGQLIEAFGTGTAAVISPIGALEWQGNKMVIHGGTTGELSKRVYDTITGIQRGTMEDPFGWTVELSR